MLPIYLEQLDRARQDVFHSLAEFKNTGYLAGGTALTLQINHRTSFDFDVFVPDELGNRLRKKIKNVFGNIRYDVNTADQISFICPNNTLVTFLWYYFTPLFPLIPTESIPLASTLNISADKAMTIGRHAVWRDYVDIFCLLHRKHTDLTAIIVNAGKKFGSEFIETQFLEQLSYFQDITITPIGYIDQPVEPKAIQSFLTAEVSRYLKKVKK